MITIKFDDSKLIKDLNNLVQYSTGFLEGAKRGKRELLHKIGEAGVEIVKRYIDSSARSNPSALHHVYEWYQVGSPDARLFDITYTVSNLGLSIKSTFRQSKVIQDGSREPFYNKARIMEDGVPVTIAPKNAEALSFVVDGERVFTRLPVTVDNPGGSDVKGRFEQTFDSFMQNYFSQAFLSKSGILAHLSDMSIYKKNFGAGIRQGRSKGTDVGYRWITNVGKIL